MEELSTWMSHRSYDYIYNIDVDDIRWLSLPSPTSRTQVVISQHVPHEIEQNSKHDTRQGPERMTHFC